VNQVWRAEITSIRVQAGFVYLVAVSDWFSRSGLSWGLSITMDVPFCVEALDQALGQGQPEILTTDQGAQFTRQAFTARLKAGGVRLSMDGRGRALDHVCVERLWRSVKDEEVYRRDDPTVEDAQHGLARYFAFDHAERLHQALGYRAPAEVYGIR
jgi:putative transposase